MGGAAVLRGIHDLDVQADALVLESTFDTLLNTTKNRFDILGVPSTPLSHLLIFWGGIYAGYNGFTFSPAQYAESAAIPTLVLHGAADTRVTKGQAKRLYDQLPAWKHFSEYVGAGHELVITKDPAKWDADFRALLSEVQESN